MEKNGHHCVDIWGLALDGSGRVGRLTHFNRYPRVQGAQPGGQRRWPVHGLSPRPGLEAGVWVAR
jgi:hypothetical protein